MRLDDLLRTDAGAGYRPAQARPLRIVHCLRSPVGGIFRHVGDLAEMQHKAGHQVGIICDSSTGGALEAQSIERLRPFLALGIQRFPMRREIAPSDLALTLRLIGVVKALNPDVLHAHGSKGGAYARTVGTLLRASGMCVARIYTPHGGSLHYAAHTMKGRVYFAIERALARMTDAFIFVSRYEADTFAAKIGATKKPTAIALNGLRPDEFEPVATASDARDFLFVGELRQVKGPDVFLNALALIRDRTGEAPSAFVIGDGPDEPRYRKMAEDLRLTGAVAFQDRMPARTAFRLANVMVMPSRNESLPYIALEAIAAGIPIVATRVGGVPEIFGPEADRLVSPGDAVALADAMTAARDAPDAAREVAARMKADIRRRFSVEAMAATVADVYARTVAG